MALLSAFAQARQAPNGFASGKLWETLKHLPREGHHPPAASMGNFPTLETGLWLGWGQHSPGKAAPLE